jgi:hypothetical protein
MPYIIVINRPGHLPEADPVAVATIEEACDVSLEEVIRSLDQTDEDVSDTAHPLIQEINALPEHGGLIGPMPDGYVIDVQFYTWLEMRAMTDVVTVGQHPSESEKELIIDHYNGRNS